MQLPDDEPELYDAQCTGCGAQLTALHVVPLRDDDGKFLGLGSDCCSALVEYDCRELATMYHREMMR